MSDKFKAVEKKVLIDQQLKEHLQLSRILINYCFTCKKHPEQKQKELCDLLYNYYEIAKNHLEVDKKSEFVVENSISTEIYDHFESFVKDIKHFIDSYESGDFILVPEIYNILSLQNEEHLMRHLKGSEVLSYIPA